MKKSWLVGVLASLVSVSAIGFASAAFNITDILNMWAGAGIFKYVLPFLLVFALVFGILTKTTLLGDNKAVHAILAATLGLLSLVGDYFPNFIEKFAPNLATGISVLLAAVILLGLFYDPADEKRKKIIWWIFAVGVVAFLLIVGDTFSGYPVNGSNIWDQYGPAIITLAIIAGAVWAITSWGKK